MPDATRKRARLPHGARPLATAPWRRAPLLLLRSPAVLVAVLFAGLVLGATVAATPLFVSSSANAALARQLAQLCPTDSALDVNVRASGVGDSGGLLERRDRAVRRVMAGDPDLGAPLLSVSGPPLALAGTAHPSRTVPARLLYRQGYGDHIRKLRTGAGPGVWVPGQAAGTAAVSPGDEVVLNLNGRTAVTRVAGTYQDLSGLPEAPFWCAARELVQPADLLAAAPPPLLLADREVYLDLTRKLGTPLEESWWEVPLASSATLSQASRIAAGLPELYQRVSDPAGSFVELERVPGPLARFLPGVPSFSSQLPLVTRRATSVVGAVDGAIGPVAVAGTIVALLLVAAAGSYWVDRRRGEVRLLATKGVGPAGMALKGALEMVLPLVVGAVLGWAVALGMVRLLGPSEVLDSSAPPRALGRTGLAVAAGVALLGLVAALRARAMTERGPGARRGLVGRIPVELAVLALAVWSLRRLTTQGAPVATGLEPPRIDLLLLAFPLLFLTGLVGLGLRLLGWAAPRLGTAGTTWPHALYLAARRLASSARLALLLLGAGALSVGVLVYAATLTRSVHSTLDAKARMFVGSDVSVALLEDRAVPAGVRGTIVGRLDRALVDGLPVDVLAVDPATFGAGVHWDSSFARKPLDALLADLAPVRPGQPIPVLAGGGPLPDDPRLEVSMAQRPGTVTLPLRVADRVRAFPGMHGGPLVVVDKRALRQVQDALERELWARGSQDEVVRGAERGGLRLSGRVLSAREVLDVSSFLAVSWTFGFLQAFGVLTGLITLAGLLLYVQTRQRSRQVVYVLTKRMGLSRAAHRDSVLVEVGLPLAAGFAAGAALSLLAARLVYLHLDALPTIPPVPLLRVPTVVIAGAAAVVLVAAWLAAQTAQRSADRVSAAEVLRLAP